MATYGNTPLRTGRSPGRVSQDRQQRLDAEASARGPSGGYRAVGGRSVYAPPVQEMPVAPKPAPALAPALNPAPVAPSPATALAASPLSQFSATRGNAALSGGSGGAEGFGGGGTEGVDEGGMQGIGSLADAVAAQMGNAGKGSVSPGVPGSAEAINVALSLFGIPTTALTALNINPSQSIADALGLGATSSAGLSAPADNAFGLSIGSLGMSADDGTGPGAFGEGVGVGGTGLGMGTGAHGALGGIGLGPGASSADAFGLGFGDGATGGGDDGGFGDGGFGSDGGMNGGDGATGMDGASGDAIGALGAQGAEGGFGGDGGGGGGGGGPCFITEATMSALGSENDQSEPLEVLRWLRDNVMLKTPEGQALVQEYYDVAPLVVEGLEVRPDAQQLFQRIYTQFIDPAVAAVRAGQYPQAMKIYAAMIEAVTPYAAPALPADEQQAVQGMAQDAGAIAQAAPGNAMRQFTAQAPTMGGMQPGMNPGMAPARPGMQMANHYADDDYPTPVRFGGR